MVVVIGAVVGVGEVVGAGAADGVVEGGGLSIGGRVVSATTSGYTFRVVGAWDCLPPHKIQNRTNARWFGTLLSRNNYFLETAS